MTLRITIALHGVLLIAMAPASAVDFGRDIQPLLADNCYACHGPDENTRQAGLRFDRRESAVTSTSSRDRAIVPGNAKESEMMRRLFSDDPDVMMPPPEADRRPDDAAKQLLAQWIDGGAEYTRHWAGIGPSNQSAGHPCRPLMMPVGLATRSTTLFSHASRPKA